MIVKDTPANFHRFHEAALAAATPNTGKLTMRRNLYRGFFWFKPRRNPHGIMVSLDPASLVITLEDKRKGYSRSVLAADAATALGLIL